MLCIKQPARYRADRSLFSDSDSGGLGPGQGQWHGSGDGGSKHSSDIEEIESIGLVRKRSFLGVSRVLACAAGMMAVS